MRACAPKRARPGDIVQITEFLKPGPAEILSMFPAGLARSMLGVVERRGWRNVALPMKVRTTALGGFLRLKLLASLRFMRPRSLRAVEEREWMERWLSLVERALAIDPDAALEIVQTAQLVRGYGDTWERGHANWRRIADELIEPLLSAPARPAHFADAVLQARLAANSDPEGARLGAVLASLAAMQPSLAPAN